MLEVKEQLPNPMIALELFGRHGLWKTLDYASRCQYLEFYEVVPEFASFARHVLPCRTTTVRVMDSIQAVRTGRLLRDDYNFVVIDNWTGARHGHYEHFDLFPNVFDRLASRAILVMNVWLSPPEWRSEAPADYPARRMEFYGVDSEEEAMSLDYETIMEAYSRKVPKGEFFIADMFLVPHPGQTLFLVMCLNRRK